jgi:hypothetical protein
MSATRRCLHSGGPYLGSIPGLVGYRRQQPPIGPGRVGSGLNARRASSRRSPVSGPYREARPNPGQTPFSIRPRVFRPVEFYCLQWGFHLLDQLKNGRKVRTRMTVTRVAGEEPKQSKLRVIPFGGCRDDWRRLESVSFGDSPEPADEIAALVLFGIKTATCWAACDGA